METSKPQPTADEALARINDRLAVLEKKAGGAPTGVTLAAVLNLLIGVVYCALEALSKADPRHCPPCP